MSPLIPDPTRSLSRRDFLQWSLTAAAGLALWSMARPLKVLAGYSDTQPEPQHGRVAVTRVDGFEKPSLSATPNKSYYQDLVLEITGVTVGDEQPEYNRVWYQVNHESYVHSGSIQPVRISPTVPPHQLPSGGALAEVCVPYTDATWSQRRPDWVAYRLYFETTHWVSELVTDEQGELWYRIDDDKWPDLVYYVRATHMRILTTQDVAPISPEVPLTEKRLEVRLPEQMVVAFEYDIPVFYARTATGAVFRDGDYRTPPGHYITNRKRPHRHMAAGDRAAANSYDLPGVPWVTYITKSGIAFHGTFWHNDFGRPRSHGCINLASPDARWIYRWTLPSVPLPDRIAEERTGTRVTVID